MATNINSRLPQKVLSVQSVPNKDITITMKVDGKVRQLNRKRDDPIKNTLKRILLNVVHQKASKAQKKAKSNNVMTTPEINLEIRRGDEKLSDDLPNADAFVEGNKLMIGDIAFDILVNAPAVASISLPEIIMAGFPVFPTVKLAFGSTEHSNFTWMASSTSTMDSSACENILWEEVGKGFSFTPTNNEMSRQLKCICTPANEDRAGPFSEEAVSTKEVSAGPGFVFADERTIFTRKYLDDADQLRVVSYNILADVFADTEHGRNNLYPYCPPYALNFYYRRQLILKELLDYHADIICLQECELKMFESFLEPAMRNEGYRGLLKLKLGDMPEGEALFFRTSRFKHQIDASVSIREAIDTPANAALKAQIGPESELLASIKKRHAIAQINILMDSQTHRHLIIVNTHLYFRPNSPDIRLLQMCIVLNYVSSFIEGHNLTDYSLLICGDMNSSKGSALLDYLDGETIETSNEVWKAIHSSSSNFVSQLKSPLNLINASGHPEFTNFVYGFQATLDYVYGTAGSFEVQSILPQPEREKIEMYGGLPNIVAPSDHLAVVLELKWL